MNVSRREFFRRIGFTVSGAAMASALDTLCRTNAWAAPAASGYRALVCVFLAGGNDSNNMVIPNGPSSDPSGGFPAYNAQRNASGLGFLQADFTTPSNSGDTRISPASFGANSFALHPTFVDTSGISGLATLFDAGQAAVVCNAGPLIKPFFDPANPTRSPNGVYQTTVVPKPLQLFSHADQVSQWQSSVSNVSSSTGWGGRTADKTLLLNATGGDPGATRFPMITSIAGVPTYTIGISTAPLTIASAPTALNQVLVLNGFGGTTDEVARKSAYDAIRAIDRGYTLENASNGVLALALGASAALSGPDPTISTTFPNTSLGNQLKQVAKVIKANLTQPALNLTRQIFFVSLGGFDTHQNQRTSALIGGPFGDGNQTGLKGQDSLMQQVNQAISAFYNWTKNNNVPNTGDIGDISSMVTAFTLSDFTRTFNPSGTGTIVGTDHAWGAHQLVVGGAVNGGDFYGVPLPSTRGGNGTVFQFLPLANQNSGIQNVYDADKGSSERGRWIPMVAVDQYAATLATWFGVAPADLSYVFPNINNFAPTTLGFMQP